METAEAARPGRSQVALRFVLPTGDALKCITGSRSRPAGPYGTPRIFNRFVATAIERNIQIQPQSRPNGIGISGGFVR